MANKANLIRTLLKDFEKMFPESRRHERLDLFVRLNEMDESDLELLVKAITLESSEKSLSAQPSLSKSKDSVASRRAQD